MNTHCHHCHYHEHNSTATTVQWGDGVTHVTNTHLHRRQSHERNPTYHDRTMGLWCHKRPLSQPQVLTEPAGSEQVYGHANHINDFVCTRGQTPLGTKTLTHDAQPNLRHDEVPYDDMPPPSTIMSESQTNPRSTTTTVSPRSGAHDWSWPR